MKTEGLLAIAGRADVKTDVPARFHRGACVYFIGGREGPVKIGFTTELPSRLRSLQNSGPVPVRLLAAVHGGRDVEREYHAKFAEHRLHGEWFARCEAIEEEIATLIWLPRVMFKFSQGRFAGQVHARR